MSGKQTVDGLRANLEGGEKVFTRTSNHAQVILRFKEDEELYGLGSHEEGYPSLKGKFVPLYQEKQYCLCSDRLEGVFLKKDCLYTFKNASITNE